jgi:hypothetical protein
MDSAAREGRPGVSSMLARFIDTATNTNPVNVAAAPACTARSVCHSDSGGMEADLTMSRESGGRVDPDLEGLTQRLLPPSSPVDTPSSHRDWPL